MWKSWLRRFLNILFFTTSLCLHIKATNERIMYGRKLLDLWTPVVSIVLYKDTNSCTPQLRKTYWMNWLWVPFTDNNIWMSLWKSPDIFATCSKRRVYICVSIPSQPIAAYAFCLSRPASFGCGAIWFRYFNWPLTFFLTHRNRLKKTDVNICWILNWTILSWLDEVAGSSGLADTPQWLTWLMVELPSGLYVSEWV